jgi:hypothetical protein
MRTRSLSARAVGGLVLAILTAVAMVAAFAAPANAGKPGGGGGSPTSVNTTFNAKDGNLTVEAPETDWKTYEGEPTLITDDMPSGALDNSFGQGSKDDNINATIVNGSIPNNKSDLTKLFFTTFPENGKQWIAGGYRRANTLGTANFSFELNKFPQSFTSSSTGPVTFTRTDGDSLILFDYASGGNVVNLGLSRWTTTGNPKTACQANNSVPCWGKVKVLNGTGLANASVNNSNFPGFSTDDPFTAAANDMPVDTFGEFVINATDAGIITGTPQLCAAETSIGSIMVRSRSSAAFDSELKDFIGPRNVAVTIPQAQTVFTPGKASGSATPLYVHDDQLVDPAKELPDPDNDPTTPSVSSSVAPTPAGVKGKDTDSASVADVHVPPPPNTLVQADVVHGDSTSEVDASVPRAYDQSRSKIVGLNVLNGVVSASVVQATAYAVHLPSGTRGDTLGIDASDNSGIQGLSIDPDGPKQGPLDINNQPPILYNDIRPGMRVNLDSRVFGDGSYVSVYEETTSNITNPANPALGTIAHFIADASVSMIHVHITDRNAALHNNPLAPTPVSALEAVVGQATAHAEQDDAVCKPFGHIVANALLAEVSTSTTGVVATKGYVTVPENGGESSREVLGFTIDGTQLAGSPTHVLTANVGNTYAFGNAFVPPTANSHAHAAGVCVLKDSATNKCIVSADAIDASTQSDATAGPPQSATSTGGASFVKLVITNPVTGAVTTIDGAAPPNTVIDLSPLVKITLNKQECFVGAGTASPCTGTNGAELRVTALEVLLLPNNGKGLPEATITVAQATSGAFLT